MFFSPELFTRRGEWALVWRAATQAKWTRQKDKRLWKRYDIVAACDPMAITLPERKKRPSPICNSFEDSLTQLERAERLMTMTASQIESASLPCTARPEDITLRESELPAVGSVEFRAFTQQMERQMDREMMGDGQGVLGEAQFPEMIDAPPSQTLALFGAEEKERASSASAVNNVNSMLAPGELDQTQLVAGGAESALGVSQVIEVPMQPDAVPAESGVGQPAREAEGGLAERTPPELTFDLPPLSPTQRPHGSQRRQRHRQGGLQVDDTITLTRDNIKAQISDYSDTLLHRDALFAHFKPAHQGHWRLPSNRMGDKIVRPLLRAEKIDFTRPAILGTSENKTFDALHRAACAQCLQYIADPLAPQDVWREPGPPLKQHALPVEQAPIPPAEQIPSPNAHPPAESAAGLLAAPIQGDETARDQMLHAEVPLDEMHDGTVRVEGRSKRKRRGEELVQNGDAVPKRSRGKKDAENVAEATSQALNENLTVAEPREAEIVQDSALGDGTLPADQQPPGPLESPTLVPMAPARPDLDPSELVTRTYEFDRSPRVPLANDELLDEINSKLAECQEEDAELTFEHLAPSQTETRKVAAKKFYILLDLIRQRAVRVEQTQCFGTISITRV